jgi:hypothetical protein
MPKFDLINLEISFDIMCLTNNKLGLQNIIIFKVNFGTDGKR